MKEPGKANWQLSINDPAPLSIGLFIRDVAAVPSREDWVPLASPAVPGADTKASEAAGQQWDAWWHEALLRERQADATEWPPDVSSWWTPPDFEALERAPELQAIVAAHYLTAVKWSSDRHQEHGVSMRISDRGLAETTLVENMERALSRTPRSFHLRITEIPVEGQQLWRLQPDHVLVTADLLRDTARYLRHLTPVLEELI